MTTLIGLSVIGSVVLVLAVVGLVSSWRRLRKESAVKKKTPDDARGETLCTWRHETGTDWRQRP